MQNSRPSVEPRSCAAFSRRLMVGCEQSAPPLSGAFPEASLNRGSARSASQSSASSHGTGFAGPRTGSTAGDCQHAEAEHGRERVDHLRLIAPVPDAACQGLGEAQAAVRLAQQDEAAVRRDQATIEGGTHLTCVGRLADRRREGYRRSWRAWRFRCSERKTLRQRIPTRWQRLTPCPPPQNQTRRE